jgi:S1-C subfamily serine protease
MSTPAKPPYLGVVGRTALACRYPAGVRISQVIEGSPAHQAGLKGEATLSWKQAVTGLLALSPAALLVSPFISDSDHGGSGDLILAVDGKRVHNQEEFEQEMRRFRPGDVVYFSILRGGSGLRQVPVHLADYPDTSTTAMVR